MPIVSSLQLPDFNQTHIAGLPIHYVTWFQKTNTLVELADTLDFREVLDYDPSDESGFKWKALVPGEDLYVPRFSSKPHAEIKVCYGEVVALLKAHIAPEYEMALLLHSTPTFVHYASQRVFALSVSGHLVRRPKSD